MERTDIQAWAAVSIGGFRGSDSLRLVETTRDSLIPKRAREQGLRPRTLRSIRGAITRLPIPRRLRLTARAAYARLAVATAPTPGNRIDVVHGNQMPSLLLIPGMFWHANTAARSRRLAEEGLPVRMILYDLFPIRNPEWYPPAQGKEFREALDELVRVCDRVVTLSDEVARQVVERYPELAGRVRVGLPKLHAHRPKLGFDEEPVPASISGPFLLALSTVEPRKNHRVILDAWERARQDPRAASVRLVVAGRRGWMADDIETEIARNGERLGILRLDRPSDALVEALYRDCIATVHASWSEGFGLPARESVARGIPTLMSSTIPKDGLPEGSFRVFEPEDSRGLAVLMLETLLAGPSRGPVALGEGTGWEPIVSALVD